jgi:hypothetical protein
LNLLKGRISLAFVVRLALLHRLLKRVRCDTSEPSAINPFAMWSENIEVHHRLFSFFIPGASGEADDKRKQHDRIIDE